MFSCPSCGWAASTADQPVRDSDLILKKLKYEHTPSSTFGILSLSNFHPSQILTDYFVQLSYWYSPYCYNVPKTPTRFSTTTTKPSLRRPKKALHNEALYNSQYIHEILALPKIKPNSTLYLVFLTDGEPDPNIHFTKDLYYPIWGDHLH